MFDDIKTDYELLDRIRIRYQMYVGSVEELTGFLNGFVAAKQINMEGILGFHKFMGEKLDLNTSAVHWSNMIQKVSERTEYEVSTFLQYMDEFRGLELKELASTNLTWEQRKHHLDKCMKTTSIDYPALPLKSPYMLKAIEIPTVKVHAFYYDEKGNKYYEQCLHDLDRLLTWAKECFNIPEDQWA